MSPRLRPCPACTRHVRVSETACPFCGGTLPSEFGAAVSLRPPPPRGISRAARYAVSATSIAVAGIAGVPVAGCSSSSGNGQDAGEELPAVFYGCAPPCGAVDGGTDAGRGGDAEKDARQAIDSGHHDAESGAMAAYGASPDH